jgi:hypothetical protein
MQGADFQPGQAVGNPKISIGFGTGRVGNLPLQIAHRLGAMW